MLAYLAGSVCFGLIAAQRSGVDLRSVGSGNIGATNVSRALGPVAGRWVMALDAAKGLLPAALAHWLLGPSAPFTAATGVAAVLGHLFPVWHGFRGGKGAATGAGVMLGVVPLAGVAGLGAFAALKRASGRASVGSLGGATVALGVTGALHGLAWPTRMALALTVLIALAHTDNIRRIFRGQEPPA